MAKKNIAYTAIVIFLVIVVLAIVFKDDIVELMRGSDAPTTETVDVTPVEENTIDKLILESEDLAKEKRYAEAIAKLEKAQTHTEPKPSIEQSQTIDRLLNLFKQELLALEKEKETIIDNRIEQAKTIAEQKQYPKAVSHLKETKNYKEPEPNQQQHETIDKLIKQYNSKIVRKKPKRKITRKYPRKIRKNTELAEALYKKAREALDKGRINRAITLFSMAIARNPQHTLAYSYRGTAHYRKKNIEKALSDSNEALKRDSEEPNAHFTKGEIYYEQMNNELAMQEYLAVIAKNKENAKAFYRIGVIELINNKNNEAIYMFDTALAITNGLNKKYTRNSHYNKGIAKERLNNLEDAENDYLESIKIDKKYPKAHVQIAEILYKKNQFNKSLEKIKNISLKLNKIEKYTTELLTGKNYEKKTNTPNYETIAIKAYSKALKTNPNGYEALYNIGRLLFNKQKYNKALPIFQKANDIKNDDYDINYAIGLTLYKLQQYKESIAFFNNAKQINKDKKEANLGLGVTHFIQNENPDIVIESLEAVIQVDPNNFIANKILGIVYFEENRQEQSIEYLEKAASLKENDTIAKKNLANALFYNNNFQAASVHYKELLGQEQNDPESLLRLSECYIKTGDKTQAKESLNNLVNKFPNYKERKEVQLYLRVLEG